MDAAFDLSETVAAEFGMDLVELAEAFGGGWYAVELSAGPEGADDASWYGTGEPIMAMLGVTRDQVWVGRPILGAPGLAGPGRVEVFVTERFERGDDVPEDFGAAIASAIWAEREHRDLCQGCREYLPVVSPNGFNGKYCSSCRESILGIIAC
jgi:hypothetical protein